MTPVQRNVYDLILAFWVTHKYSPTYRELSAGTGMSATHAYRNVKRLAGRGILHVISGKNRGIYPVHEWEALTGATNAPLLTENRKMRKALKEISAIAKLSEGGEFYVMLAEKGLGDNG
jgi:SOS-response transcriptional repressor LexA